MKAKELQIGDWVQFADGNKKCTVVGVKCDARYLEDEAIITVMDRSGHWFDKEMDHLKPIQLTAEILEVNGIEYHMGAGGYPVLDIEGLNCSVSFNLIKYVHELQHALRLCGIEKTIEL